MARSREQLLLTPDPTPGDRGPHLSTEVLKYD